MNWDLIADVPPPVEDPSDAAWVNAYGAVAAPIWLTTGSPHLASLAP
jgi:hypothetical protein